MVSWEFRCCKNMLLFIECAVSSRQKSKKRLVNEHKWVSPAPNLRVIFANLSIYSQFATNSWLSAKRRTHQAHGYVYTMVLCSTYKSIVEHGKIVVVVFSFFMKFGYRLHRDCDTKFSVLVQRLSWNKKKNERMGNVAYPLETLDLC